MLPSREGEECNLFPGIRKKLILRLFYIQAKGYRVLKYKPIYMRKELISGSGNEKSLVKS